LTARALSKSKYLAGCQCPRRVWLACRAPELGAEPDAAKQAIFEMGHEVGRSAHELFPGGVLVSQPPWEHRQAIRQTRALLATRPFRRSSRRLRARRRGSGGRAGRLQRRFGLREVKRAAGCRAPGRLRRAAARARGLRPAHRLRPPRPREHGVRARGGRHRLGRLLRAQRSHEPGGRRAPGGRNVFRLQACCMAAETTVAHCSSPRLRVLESPRGSRTGSSTCRGSAGARGAARGHQRVVDIPDDPRSALQPHPGLRSDGPGRAGSRPRFARPARPPTTSTSRRRTRRSRSTPAHGRTR
jgi:hypothetical protein